ncbi:NAD(P)/FAD-dependent oxidoreductase [Amycolatopsis rhabdoformis]|uniref:NAD(P)/FAD-dependent oxidoreductase n=1 Tax=Amycolatopsis rhabdoformis TaxID=1448059 RepID=A0ABZ1IKY5_9PSEU|nr:NAD(P)/FAD-dependent oxidoreductase [Amycolatopsis rhabdoformis]WSE34888.1 NAD(P)/FAD-dependent oxidoreductase [Amycolatopsis rhabdoformis]
MTLRIAVVGGGTGGLCLAHGLVRAGVEVAVYERSRTRTERLQGYRVHIDPHGAAALHECLPAEAWQRFLATTGESAHEFAFVTERLRELAVLREPPAADPSKAHHSVSRISLHQVLSAGLDGILWHDKEFVRYDLGPKAVTLHFADGTTADADLVIGADGANSRVRAQLRPEAHRVDTGIVTIVGKTPVSEAAARFTAGPVYVVAPPGCGMFTAPHLFPELALNDETAEIDPVHFDNTGSYVMWAYGARRLSASEETLRDSVLSLIRGWHPDLVRLVEATPHGTVSRLPILTSVPARPGIPGPVTLLGDAAHSMTPFRGIGANTALRDAQLLCRKLTSGIEPAVAVAQYEGEMRKYADKAVRTSARSAEQFVSESRLGRVVAKAMFRAMGAAQKLRR